MRSTAPVRFGIVGAGRIARNAFCPALELAANAELYGVASRAPERAAALGCKRVYGDYGALLEDPQIEAVYIATHNGLHHELTLHALARGKHVLCEKPLGCTAAQCREMIDAAQARGLILLEGFMYRYHPQISAAKDLLQGIGEIRTVEASFSYFLDSSDDVRLNPDWGGGSVYDVGCYCVNFCRLFFECMPRQVVALADFHPRHRVDMSLQGLLDFGQGRFGIISCGFDAGLRRRALICGTKGTISLPCAFLRHQHPMQLIVNECLEPRVVPVAGADVFRLQIEDFARAVRGGPAPLLDAEEGYRNACVIDALLDSAEQGGAAMTVTAR